MLWQIPDGRTVDELSPECRDQIRRIDTSCLICDPPAKRMNTLPLDGMVSRSHMSLNRIDAGVLAKIHTQKEIVVDVSCTPIAEVVEAHSWA